MDSSLPEAPITFWKRQFDSNPTSRQYLFDVFAGVILPIFCLWLFPIVMRHVVGESAGHYPIGGMIAIGLSMISLTAWLLLQRPAAFLAGVMFASAALAFMIALVLAPFSAVGIRFAGIGILGFSPFLTTFVYFRNSIRARRLASCPASRNAGVIGFLLYIAVPSAAQAYIRHESHQAIRMLESADLATSEKGAQMLRRFRRVFPTDDMLLVYKQEQDPERRRRLTSLYNDLTGENIDKEVHRFD